MPVEQTTYACQKCGAPVAITSTGVLVRSCNCGEQTGVVANLKAVAAGAGGASS